jgi:predicted lipoprotein with Yx(FWY)xxD motif
MRHAPLALLVLVPLVLAGAAAGRPAAGSRHATVETRQGPLGTHLADGKGRTLYRFLKDTGRKSTCTGVCAQNWPPLTTKEKPEAEGRAKQSRLSTKRRKDGRRQVLYDGHPLYRFAGDSSPGDANGQGINAFGGLWYVVAPSGKAIKASGASSPSPSPY